MKNEFDRLKNEVNNGEDDNELSKKNKIINSSYVYHVNQRIYYYFYF